MIIYGLHPVLEALRAGTVSRLRIAERSDDRARAVLDLAAAEGVRVEHVPADALSRV